MFKEDLGKMSSFEASLHFIPNATPKFIKARSVPFALRGAIQVELERLYRGCRCHPEGKP